MSLKPFEVTWLSQGGTIRTTKVACADAEAARAYVERTSFELAEIREVKAQEQT